MELELELNIIDDKDIFEALAILKLEKSDEYLNIAKGYINFDEISKNDLDYNDLDEQSLFIVNKIVEILDKKIFDENKPYEIDKSINSNIRLNETIYICGYEVIQLNTNIIEGKFFEESGFTYECFNEDGKWDAYGTPLYGGEPQLYKKYDCLE